MNIDDKDDDSVGFLFHKDGDRAFTVVGHCCANKPSLPGKLHSKVYKVNILPIYSQDCAFCGTILVKGASKTILFNGE